MASPKGKRTMDNMNYKDYLIMAFLSISFGVLALLNLGSYDVPQTGWKPSKVGESLTIDLGRRVNVSRVSYYCGMGGKKNTGTQFRLEYLENSDGEIDFKPLKLLDGDGFYSWSTVNVNIWTSALRIVNVRSGGAINEIGIFESGNIKPLQNSGPFNGAAAALFDEQEMVQYSPSYKTGTYFDEIFHSRTAYEHINGIQPYDTSHPPLGKLIISAGMLIFGTNPFGWRFFGVLFGTAMLPLTYLFGRKLFEKRFFAFLSAFLLMFDFMHFTLSRIGTIDIFVAYFTLLMFYFMYDYYSVKSYSLDFKNYLKPLFLSGFSFALCAACKWTAAFGAVGLAFLFLTVKVREWKEYTKYKYGCKTRTKPWGQQFIPIYANKTVLFSILFFGAIPLAIYILSYIPIMRLQGPGYGLKGVLVYQEHMLNYHSNIKGVHSFSSPWWSWPLDLRPVWYYKGIDSIGGKVSSIICMGNPAIWWLSIPAFISAGIIALRKRDKKIVTVIIAFASLYFFWGFVGRQSFIYYYFPTVPFAALMISYVFKNLIEKFPRVMIVLKFYILAVIVLFLAFYPVLTGLYVKKTYIQSLEWFKSWVFF